MRVLLTGASSGLGRGLMARLAAAPIVTELWCGSRRPVPAEGKIRPFRLDLEASADLAEIPGPVDLVVHAAGLTHSPDLARYAAVNRDGTAKLARAARAKDCRRMAYISTRCVGPRSGAYGESKKAAEDLLLGMDWERLLIIRPSEVYGAGSGEGVDAFIRLARRRRLVPMLFGAPGIAFAPIHADDFLSLAAAAILSTSCGTETLEAHGPETFDGVELALRLARRYRALPVPVFVPALGWLGAAARPFGAGLFAPDQLARLTGGKSSGPPAGDPRTMRRFPY